MKRILLSVATALFLQTNAQDTFSIVAMDINTGEVGSAGASCVDLFNTPFDNDSFLGVLFPGQGAINTQASYIPQNQDNATQRMLSGDTPREIIDWLISNDIQGNPNVRQYGIVGKVADTIQTAGYTGSSTLDYKGHIEGVSYCIQGNILLGPEVLESMEANFKAEPGDLKCKLMAALMGAKRVGAD